ncbi:hypothetical protein [Alkalihalophilus marmarensis]|uniref:hypothetical protein n=1 Tax=Alkalihalophilus marmarensis TaxID=521377 RepID=UPI00128F50A6|nr:hypothetical protein [Alkalihalophilus marmarensis]
MALVKELIALMFTDIVPFASFIAFIWCYCVVSTALCVYANYNSVDSKQYCAYEKTGADPRSAPVFYAC